MVFYTEIFIKSKEKTYRTYLKLIDTLVKPVMLYSCEVWGESFFQKEFKSKIERFHLAMCKQILGVNKRAKNVGTLSEFGRYPFYTNIQTQIFKYFQRFVFVDKDTLLYKSFQEE